MKKTFCLILISLLILFSACTQGTSSEPMSSNIEPAQPNESSSEVESVEIPPEDSSFDKGEDNNEEITFNETEIIDYALYQAKHFRETVEDVKNLNNNPHYFEFIINMTYKIYTQNNFHYNNISEKDWYEEYLIPNDNFVNISNLLLDTTPPEKIYIDTDFAYQKDSDSFLYSPFSPPMFETHFIELRQNDDKSISIAISIARIEEDAFATNIYTFKTISDSEFGTLYQLMSIEAVA